MASSASFDDASRGTTTLIAQLSCVSPWTRHLPSKLPEVTLLFWAAKILATVVGGITAEFFSDDLGLGLTATTAIMSLFCAEVLVWQVSLRRHVPGVYWLTVLLVSSVGTLVSDNLVLNLGVDRAEAVAFFAVGLGLVFVGWWRSERTLSIHTVFTRRRETWYWVAVLGAFALGKSVGDLVAQRLDVGPVGAGLLFAGALTVLAVVRFGLGLNAAVGFWSVYVVTGPFGASTTALITVPATEEGPGGAASVIGALLLIAIVGWFTVRRTGSRSGAGQVGHPSLGA